MTSSNTESWVFPIGTEEEYDAIGVLKKFGEIDYGMNKGDSCSKAPVGTEVYFYKKDPEQAIVAKAEIVNDNVSSEDLIDDSKFRGSHKKSKSYEWFIRLKLKKIFIKEIKDRLTYKLLKAKGLKGSMQGKARLNEIGIDKYVKEVEEAYSLQNEVKGIEEFEEYLKNNFKDLNETERYQMIKARIGQGIFREELIELYDKKCMICGLSTEELLIASHIKPWKDSTPNEKTDKFNGLLLCREHDGLFDKRFITITKDNTIDITNIGLSNGDKDLILKRLDINKKYDIPQESKKYLRYHRDNVFKGKIG